MQTKECSVKLLNSEWESFSSSFNNNFIKKDSFKYSNFIDYNNSDNCHKNFNFNGIKDCNFNRRFYISLDKQDSFLKYYREFLSTPDPRFVQISCSLSKTFAHCIVIDIDFKREPYADLDNLEKKIAKVLLDLFDSSSQPVVYFMAKRKGRDRCNGIHIVVKNLYLVHFDYLLFLKYLRDHITKDIDEQCINWSLPFSSKTNDIDGVYFPYRVYYSNNNNKNSILCNFNHEEYIDEFSSILYDVVDNSDQPVYKFRTFLLDSDGDVDDKNNTAIFHLLRYENSNRVVCKDLSKVERVEIYNKKSSTPKDLGEKLGDKSPTDFGDKSPTDFDDKSSDDFYKKSPDYEFISNFLKANCRNKKKLLYHSDVTNWKKSINLLKIFGINDLTIATNSNNSDNDFVSITTDTWKQKQLRQFLDSIYPFQLKHLEAYVLKSKENELKFCQCIYCYFENNDAIALLVFIYFQCQDIFFQYKNSIYPNIIKNKNGLILSILLVDLIMELGEEYYCSNNDDYDDDNDDHGQKLKEIFVQKTYDRDIYLSSVIVEILKTNPTSTSVSRLIPYLQPIVDNTFGFFYMNYRGTWTNLDDRRIKNHLYECKLRLFDLALEVFQISTDDGDDNNDVIEDDDYDDDNTVRNKKRKKKNQRAQKSKEKKKKKQPVSTIQFFINSSKMFWNDFIYINLPKHIVCFQDDLIWDSQMNFVYRPLILFDAVGKYGFEYKREIEPLIGSTPQFLLDPTRVPDLDRMKRYVDETENNRVDIVRVLWQISALDIELFHFFINTVCSVILNTLTKKVYFLHGPSANNGKSTFIKILHRFFKDKMQIIQSSTIYTGMKNINDDLSKCRNMKIICVDEIDGKKLLNETVIKSLSGDCLTNVRPLYKSGTTSNIDALLLLASNDIINITMTNAIRSRLVGIPFNAQFMEVNNYNNIVNTTTNINNNIVKFTSCKYLDSDYDTLAIQLMVLCYDRINYFHKTYPNDDWNKKNHFYPRCVVQTTTYLSETLDEFLPSVDILGYELCCPTKTDDDLETYKVSKSELLFDINFYNKHTKKSSATPIDQLEFFNNIYTKFAQDVNQDYIIGIRKKYYNNAVYNNFF